MSQKDEAVKQLRFMRVRMLEKVGRLQRKLGALDQAIAEMEEKTDG